MQRLDQLKLTDDTALGLTFVWLYMLAEAFSNSSMGAYWLARWFIGNPLTEQGMVGGLFQVSALLFSALLIGAARIVVVKRRLAPRSLIEVDTPFSAEASYLAAKLRVGKANFLCTSNMADGNAFCLPAFGQTSVILGGGLRVLIRKEPLLAKAILAHECAHLSRGDAWLLVGTWYTFLAFCALTVINALISQVTFWSNFAKIMPNPIYFDGLGEWFLSNIRLTFLNGLPSLFAAVALGFLVAHLLRTREFFADEAAAQAGYRNAIARNMIRMMKDAPNSKLTRRFHPSPQDRLARVADGLPWTRLDVLFCLGGGALLARADALYPGGGMVFTGTADRGLDELLDNLTLVPVQTWLMMLIYVSLIAALVFLIGHHLYRTLLSKRAFSRSFGEAVQVTVSAFALSVAGVFIGQLTSSASISVMYSHFVLREALNLEAIDQGLSSIIVLSLVLFVIVGAVLVTTYIAEICYSKSKWIRFFGLLGTMLVSALLVQVLVNLISMVIYTYDIFSWAGPNIEFPRTTEGYVMGMAGPLQIFLALVIFAVCIWLATSIFRSHFNGKDRPTRLHAMRFLNDPVKVEQT